MSGAPFLKVPVSVTYDVETEFLSLPLHNFEDSLDLKFYKLKKLGRKGFQYTRVLRVLFMRGNLICANTS